MALIVLQINCGFARTAIFNLSLVQRGKRRSTLDRKKRLDEFQRLFSGNDSFSNRNHAYWNHPFHTRTLFDRHFDFILDCFSKMWKNDTRNEYIETFSDENWNNLSLIKRECNISCLAAQLVLVIT